MVLLVLRNYLCSHLSHLIIFIIVFSYFLSNKFNNLWSLFLYILLWWLWKLLSIEFEYFSLFRLLILNYFLWTTLLRVLGILLSQSFNGLWFSTYLGVLVLVLILKVVFLLTNSCIFGKWRFICGFLMRGWRLCIYNLLLFILSILLSLWRALQSFFLLFIKVFGFCSKIILFFHIERNSLAAFRAVWTWKIVNTLWSSLWFSFW